MIILAIDTSCDETAVAVTRNTEIVSNMIWSQASLHSSFGGVMPSLAQRQHEARIDWVIQRALGTRDLALDIDAIAVTIGNGLGIALGVGINKAKELAIKYKKPLIPVSHTEAHLLSSLARPKISSFQFPISNQFSNLQFPSFGLVLSGGTTVLCLVKAIDEYEILAETSDDALGEALDKGARLLGLGYPGGAILEKFAKTGDPKKYKLPLPLQNDRIKNRFSYSGLKTAFVRLFNDIKDPNKQDIADLAASFQNTAFLHIEKVLEYQVSHMPYAISHMLFGGGVAANSELRKRLRKVCKKNNIIMHTPYNLRLCGDNAGMIGVCAYLKNKESDLIEYFNYDSVDRNPRLSITNN